MFIRKEPLCNLEDPLILMIPLWILDSSTIYTKMRLKPARMTMYHALIRPIQLVFQY